jgi:hypothetical protein
MKMSAELTELAATDASTPVFLTSPIEETISSKPWFATLAPRLTFPMAIARSFACNAVALEIRRSWSVVMDACDASRRNALRAAPTVAAD